VQGLLLRSFCDVFLICFQCCFVSFVSDCFFFLSFFGLFHSCEALREFGFTTYALRFTLYDFMMDETV
jgi:hypothetical protein